MRSSEALVLGTGDHLLKVGCGGGLLLPDALATGARVTGLDHSEDMVALAHDRAPGAEVVHAKAEALAFADQTFTAVAMSIVFFFLDDPIGVLRECRRVLRPGERRAIYTTGPELRGTQAAPEPLASRGHFFRDEELVELARHAGLGDARVSNDHGGATPHNLCMTWMRGRNACGTDEEDELELTWRPNWAWSVLPTALPNGNAQDDTGQHEPPD